ncbi:MAG: hypothetical protein JO112_08825, partial [Planctomycetes bacterium]|nr:hypothetical protein [Planctomycetota bacterium]
MPLVTGVLILVLLGGGALVLGGGYLIYKHWKTANTNEQNLAAGKESPAPAPETDRLQEQDPSVAGPLAIKTTPLDGDQATVPLAAPADEVCAGGAGRFLILHLPTLHQLAIFDVNEARIVKSLPTPDDDVQFAADRDDLVVALPSNGSVLQRWSLTTFEKEAVAACPLPGRIQLAMGSGSNGPLVLVGGAQPGQTGGTLKLLDPKTFQESQFQVRENSQPLPGYGIPVGRLHVSADGKVITGPWNLARQENTYVPIATVPNALPAADFLCGVDQLWSLDGKVLGETVGGYGHRVWFVPGVQGPYFVSVNETREGGWQNLSLRLGVHVAANPHPVLTFPQFDALKGLMDYISGQPQPFERHVFLIPNAKLLAVLPLTRDKLVLYRFDLDQLLDKSGNDSLFVTSLPPSIFKPGETFTYDLAVRSKKGPVQYRLESGPAGMAVSSTGRVVWGVPAGFAETKVTVILTLQDTGGQKITHTFQLTRPNTPPAQNPLLASPPNPWAPGLPPNVFPPRAPNTPPAPESAPRTWYPVQKPAGDFARGAPLVRTPAETLPIQPAPLQEARATVALPAPVRDVCVGGGGRFLILHLPSQHQLAVFDVNQARIVKYLPMEEDHILFAAGMTKLMVVLPEKHRVQRWSLTSWECEATAALPMTAKVHTASMGSATEGALILGGPELGHGPLPLCFLDIQTLKEVAVEAQAGAGQAGIIQDYPGAVRVSANGQTIGTWNAGLHPSGLETITVQGNRVQVTYVHEEAGHVIPGPDGRTVFTGSGLYTSDAKKISAGAQGALVTLPALEGNYYLSLPTPLTRFLGNRQDTGTPVAIYLLGNTQPQVTLDNLEGLDTPNP